MARFSHLAGYQPEPGLLDLLQPGEVVCKKQTYGYPLYRIGFWGIGALDPDHPHPGWSELARKPPEKAAPSVYFGKFDPDGRKRWLSYSNNEILTPWKFIPLYDLFCESIAETF